MKVRNLAGDRFKEQPADCVVESHALMVRGGYIRQVANGIYSLYTPAKRICAKIEKILREEMDRIDCQEVLFPVVLPASLWKESGRYESVDNTLVRFTDRNNMPLILGMTHEEAAVQLVRDTASSYSKYPLSFFQIQTKFRDEARPRAGLIRVREFTMKDAYSFHTSQEDLEKYYARMYRAYERIYARAGVPEVVPVKSDSGMMGGAVSHEYMLLTDIGEDSIVICPECGYRANMEAADNIVENEQQDYEPLTKVSTPGTRTIEAVVDYLHGDVKHSVKAVVYQQKKDDVYVVVFVRGDMEVNETKLTNLLGEGVYPAQIGEDTPLTAGFIGPYGISDQVRVVLDKSLQGGCNMVAGANEENYHYTGLCMERDLPNAQYVDVSKAVNGGICPHCGKKTLTISRGIEVGNIFQLGTKYTKTMGMTYTDENGRQQYPVMGSYGIGVGRLAASICEAKHDQYGPIWPVSVAPWTVEVCCLRSDDEAVRSLSDSIYEGLQRQGIDTLYDDRDVRPGVMFSDADLFGSPVRVIVSPKNLKNGEVEIATRDKSVQVKVPREQALEKVKEIIGALQAAIDEKVPESL